MNFTVRCDKSLNDKLKLKKNRHEIYRNFANFKDNEI